MKAPALRPQDIAKRSDRLTRIRAEELAPLPPPYEDFNTKPLTELKEEKIANIEASLDGTVAIAFPSRRTGRRREIPESLPFGPAEAFEKENNWTFLQPLLLSMEHCAKCQTCSDACPVFEMSGRQEIYRPNFRSEVLRRIYRKYIKLSEKYRPSSRAISI